MLSHPEDVTRHTPSTTSSEGLLLFSVMLIMFAGFTWMLCKRQRGGGDTEVCSKTHSAGLFGVVGGFFYTSRPETVRWQWRSGPNATSNSTVCSAEQLWTMCAERLPAACFELQHYINPQPFTMKRKKTCLNLLNHWNLSLQSYFVINIPRHLPPI